MITIEEAVKAGDPSVLDVLAQISKAGIRVDEDGLAEGIALAQKQLLEAQVVLDEASDLTNLRKSQHQYFDAKKDRHFNPRSTKHLTAWLIEHEVKVPNSFKLSILERILPGELYAAVKAEKHARNTLSALEGLQRRSVFERIHPQWIVATTGRFYAKDPQVQTMNRAIRGYLVPEEGNAFYVIDWEQQELRILAHVTQEPTLVKVFEEGGDPHVATFETVLRRNISDDPETAAQQRDIGKMLNYALIYGLDADGLGERLKIPTDQAQLLLNAHFEAMPVLAAWREEQKQVIFNEGGVTLLDGTFIKVDPEERRDWKARLERKAVNYYVQGLAARQLAAFLLRIADYGHKKNMLNRVRCAIHDAILVELPADLEKARPALDWFKLVMQMAVFGMPPCPVSVKGPASNWLEAMAAAEPEFTEYEPVNGDGE